VVLTVIIIIITTSVKLSIGTQYVAINDCPTKCNSWVYCALIMVSMSVALEIVGLLLLKQSSTYERILGS